MKSSAFITFTLFVGFFFLENSTYVLSLLFTDLPILFHLDTEIWYPFSCLWVYLGVNGKLYFLVWSSLCRKIRKCQNEHLSNMVLLYSFYRLVDGIFQYLLLTLTLIKDNNRINKCNKLRKFSWDFLPMPTGELGWNLDPKQMWMRKQPPLFDASCCRFYRFYKTWSLKVIQLNPYLNLLLRFISMENLVYLLLILK